MKLTLLAAVNSGLSDLVSSCLTKVARDDASAAGASEVGAEPPSSALAKAVPLTVKTLIGILMEFLQKFMVPRFFSPGHYP